MDEKVLKWITTTMVVLTMVVCGMLFWFPDIHDRSVLAAEEYYELLGENLAVEAVEITSLQAPEEIVEEDSRLASQLKIELPEGIQDSDIFIENEYLTQTVYIHIPTDVSDYFSTYRVKGTCEHIAALNYYLKNGEGVIALGLDKVYEISESFQDGSLYLDFLNTHDVYDKVVVVDAGHGGKDGGASKSNVHEKDINLRMLLQLKALLDENDQNIGVYYTRTTDVNPSYSRRVQLANKADADLFISIHNNSSASGRYSSLHGTEVMFSESQSGEFSSENFARICLDEITASLGSRKIALVEGDSIYIIRNSKVPVALLEIGFLTNREEVEKLQDEEYQKKVAEGIVSAINKAFEKGF